jgi:hypothetical protein
MRALPDGSGGATTYARGGCVMRTQRQRCSVPGCPWFGLSSDSVKGTGPWYCRRHQRIRDNRAPRRDRIAAEMAFYAPTPETPCND